MSLLAAVAGSLSGGPVVSLASLTDVTDVAVESTAFAGFKITNGGKIQIAQGALYNDVGYWISPASAAGSGYSVKVTPTLGSINGTSNTWLTLGTTREWYLQRESYDLGTSTCEVTVELRKGSGSTLVSKSITITAEVTSL